MSEALWAHRPRPAPGSPVRGVWHGSPTTPAELRDLRRQLREAHANGGRPPGVTKDDVDRLLLTFEELASNGLRHGRAPVRTVVTGDGSGWLIEVSDAAGEAAPTPAVDRDPAFGGLGLYLVAKLSGAHGWHEEDHGRKVVWARVDAAGPGRAGVVRPPVAARPEAPGDGAGRSTSPGRRTPRRLSVAVAAVVLIVTVGLAWLASTVNASNNERLLAQQVAEAATLLSTQVAVLQTQMGDAGQVAVATDGRPGPFTNFAAGTAVAPEMSMSLWRVTGDRVERLAVHGSEPLLPPEGADVYFRGLRPTGQLTVPGVLGGESPRLAYAVMPAGSDTGLVVYAEMPLTRRVSVEAGAAFGGLDLAVYLGPDEDPDQLIQATAPTPIRGDTATTSVPFGNSRFTVVAASRTGLTGPLSAALPWIVLGVGSVLAVAGGATVEVLSRRRAVAEGLAAENERLYRQQRGIAGTLQHALLPEVPRVEGVEVAARYVAGVDELDVGGDWYDVIERPCGSSVFVVGDISGRGLAAATTMAALRFAVRAYLAQGDDISVVLTRLRGLLDIDVDHQFATVLLGELDPSAGRIRIVSAGHFGPLVLSADGARFVECPVAPPVGVPAAAPPVAAEVRVLGRTTLLAFTDGAVERRREDLDTGLERLRSTAVAADALPLPAVLDRLMQIPTDNGGRDDTVILGLRWTT